MDFVAPTPANLKALYPAFSGVADAKVQASLDDASADVGDTWLPTTRRSAIMALAAHRMTLGGALGPESGYAFGGGAVSELRAADHQIKFAHTSGSAAGGTAVLGDYATTAYGLRYLELRSRSFPSVLVV